MERKSQAHAGTIYRARPAGVDWPVRLRPPADQSCLRVSPATLVGSVIVQNGARR